MTRPDVQAALTVIGRRNTPERDQIDLSNAYLPLADLSGAKLNRADLNGVTLADADLSEAKLAHTIFATSDQAA